MRKEALETVVGLLCKPKEKPPSGVLNGDGVFSGWGVSNGSDDPPIPDISHGVGVHTPGKLRNVAVGVGICTVGGKEEGGKGFREERGFAKIESTMINATRAIIKIPIVRKLRSEACEDPEWEKKEDFTGWLP